MGKLNFKSIVMSSALSLLFLNLVGCTGKGGGADLEKSSEIVISPGDLLQISSKEFYGYSDKDFSFYLREVADGNKLTTILDVTPNEDDRKAGARIHKSIIPKGVSLSGTYVVEVVMDNFPDFKLNSIYIPDSVVEPGIASSLAWEALTSDGKKSFNKYTKEQVVSVYEWIKNYIPGHKKLFGINDEISFVQLYKFLRNGLANNLEFINFLNSLGTSFNYDLTANYVDGPILFGQVKYPPVIDPTFTRPSPGDSAIKENERIIFQTYARDLAGDMVFYSWQLKNDLGEWELFDANTNVISWTPKFGDARKTPYEFRVLISNGGPFSLWNGTLIPSWNVFVSPNVRAPSITEIDCPTQAFVRTEYKCRLKGTDPTGYKLKWRVYPSSNLFAYTYVNGIRIDDIANPQVIESENNEILISLTPLNVDGIQFPTFSHLVKLVNEPGEYPELAATDTKPVRFTVNDNAQAPVFQAMARPYSNWNPYVFGYDLKKDEISTLPAQSPSYISESFINKTLNDYEFGPLRQWDNICNSDPDSGRAAADPKNFYYFQVKVKSLDDEFAAPGADRDATSKPSDRKDRFQLMTLVPDGMTQPNLSLEQVLEVDDPASPGNKIDLLATNYNSTDFTTVFHFRINLKDFKKSNKNGEKYGVQICSDHTGPAPSYAPLCAQLGFGFQIESRTPCVKIASNGTDLATDESMTPFRKTGSASPTVVGTLTTPVRLNIQAAGSTAGFQDCTTQDCSMGADLQVEMIPTGVDATDSFNHRVLKDLPFLLNVTRIAKRDSVLTDTNTLFVFTRNSLTDNFSYQLPYPDPYYYTDEYPMGTPLAEFPPEQQRAARQEINATSYAIVPGYVALRSSSGAPERFGILTYYPYPAAVANRPDLSHMAVPTETPLPVRNRLLANYNVSLPGTGVSRNVKQYFMIPARGRPTTNLVVATNQYSAPLMGNTMCRTSLSGSYALLGTEVSGASRNNNQRFARLLDYTLFGNFVFNSSVWLADPVVEVATPVWPCFPGEDLRTTSTVELIKTTGDSNIYSGITFGFKEGPDQLGNNAHFTHYPLDIGRKGLMVSYILLNSATSLPTRIPKGTYFNITKQIQLDPLNVGNGDLPGAGSFQENFLFKTIVDTEIKPGSLTAQIPAVFAWEEMKVPKNVLQWDPLTWQFDYVLPGTEGAADRNISITSAKWDVYHPEFFPFIGWNRFDVKTKLTKEESTLKIGAQNRMIVEVGEISRFQTAEPLVKKMISNAAPVSAMNERAIFGNMGKVKVFNNSADNFVYDPALNYPLYFKSYDGAIFSPNAAFTVPAKSDLEVSVTRSAMGNQEPVQNFLLNKVESSNPNHVEFLGDFPFLLVTNESRVKGYTTQVKIQNKFSQSVTIDLTKTLLRTRSGIQFKFQQVTAGSDSISFPANSSALYWVERDVNQNNPDLSSETSIKVAMAEKDNDNFSIAIRNSVDIDKDFLSATTFSQSILSGSSMTEKNMAVFEPDPTTSNVVSPNSVNDLYETYEYFVDTAASTPLPPSCTPVGSTLPATCKFQLCRFPSSVDATCATPCAATSSHDSRYCHVRFTSTAADVDTQGRAYNFVVKAKGKEVTTASKNSLTYAITVNESNSAPILTFLNGDPTSTTVINDFNNYKEISTISAGLGTSLANPFNTSSQSSYSGASSSVNFAGFIEGKTVVTGKDNSFRLLAKSTTKTSAYSSLKAQVTEFYYADAAGNFIKEIDSATDSPKGIPKGIQIGSTVQPNAVSLTCITLPGETANSCMDNLYDSYGYAELRWVPNDLQAKKYSHANGVIMKVEYCSNCSSGTEPKAAAYYRFLVVNKNTSAPAFVAMAGTNFTIPDEGANISNSVKNNVVDATDKSEIKVYADSYLKFTMSAEDSDGYSPFGSPWATILSLCKNNTVETSTQVCPFDTWYGSDFSLLLSRAKTSYDGNKYLSDGVTINSACRNNDGSIKTDLVIPRITASSLTSTANGKRKYEFTIEWCPQRSHLGRYAGSVFVKDFGDLDRQAVRDAAVETSASLKFNVVSRPYFISPRFDFDLGSSNPASPAFQNNHFMRQAYADSPSPFEYYFIVNNTLKNPLVFTLGSPYTATSGCSVSATVPSCQLNDGDGNTANDVTLRRDPKNPDVAILSWSPNSTNLSPNINSPKTFRIQVKDSATNLADNVSFSVLVKSASAPSALYGASDSYMEVAPKITSVQASLKDRWNANKTYTQLWDGTNYSYSDPEAQVLEVAEGQDINFLLNLNSPVDQNPYDALFVRWFLDGSVVADNDLSVASELPVFKYSPDSAAAGAQVAIGSLNLPRGYHHLRVELTDGSLKDTRDWYIKVRNLRPYQDATATVDLVPLRQTLSPQTITSLVWSQDSLINYTTDSNLVTDYLVIAANYKANSLDRQSVWNIPFVNGAAKLAPQASDPAIYNESLSLNPKTIARLDYLKESGGFRVYLTSESRRLEGYQASGSNAVITDLFPRYTSVSPAPCTDLCTQNYYNSGDDVSGFENIVDRGSGDSLSQKFTVTGARPIKVFATASSDRRILYLDKGNLDSKTDLSAVLALPSQLEIRAFTYEPDGKVLYVAASNRDATGTAMTLIKRIQLSKASANSKGISETFVSGVDFDVLSDIELMNGAAKFDFKINGAALVPGPNLTDTIKNRVIFLSGNIPGGGGALVVVNPNTSGYVLKRDASNTLSASTTDVPGKGRRMVYSTRDQVLVGLVVVGKQYVFYDPYLEQVTLSSASGFSPSSLLVSPSGLILAIDRAAGKLFQIK